jgi:hypothetical protein
MPANEEVLRRHYPEELKILFYSAKHPRDRTGGPGVPAAD